MVKLKDSRGGVILSFNVDDQTHQLLRNRHEQVCARLHRFQLRAIVRGQSLPKASNACSFSAWCRRQIEVLNRRSQTNRVVHGALHRLIPCLDAPTDADLARVTLSLSVDPFWTGYIHMASYQRWQKRYTAETLARISLAKLDAEAIGAQSPVFPV
jgi:hypothetical protein